MKLLSIVQISEHPSLDCVFPSSHSSLADLIESPQILIQPFSD